jgi:hypothetical protein
VNKDIFLDFVSCSGQSLLKERGEMTKTAYHANLPAVGRVVKYAKIQPMKYRFFAFIASFAPLRETYFCCIGDFTVDRVGFSKSANFVFGYFSIY